MIDPLRDFPLVRDGYRKGIREGETRGEARGKAKSLLTLLKARGLAVSAAVRTKILACTSDATLDRWFTAALTVSSVAEVIKRSSARVCHAIALFRSFPVFLGLTQLPK